MILGHAHPRVLEALSAALERGWTFGAPTVAEVKLAERITEFFPSIDSVRLVNSGTEATMSAIRLARGYTERDAIIKFEGCYHGHADGLLVKAGSGAMTFGVPSSPGVPESYARHTLVAPFNDLAATRAIVERHAENLAAIRSPPLLAAP